MSVGMSFANWTAPEMAEGMIALVSVTVEAHLATKALRDRLEELWSPGLPAITLQLHIEDRDGIPVRFEYFEGSWVQETIPWMLFLTATKDEFKKWLEDLSK